MINYYQDLLHLNPSFYLEDSAAMVNARECGLSVGPNGPFAIVSTLDGRYLSVFFETSGTSHKLNLVPVAGCERKVLHLSKIGSRSLALFADGTLMEKQGDQWIPVESVRNLRFNFLSGSFPVYSFLVDENTDLIPLSSDFDK